MFSNVCKAVMLALTLVCGLPVFAQNANTILSPHVAASRQTLPIGNLIQLSLREPASYLVMEGDVPLSQVLAANFLPLSASELNQGVSKRRFWLRFTLHNDALSERRWLVHNEVSYIDFLNIYVRDVVSPDQLGRGSANDFVGSTISDRQPFDTRPVDYRRLTYARFPLSVLAGMSLSSCYALKAWQPHKVLLTACDSILPIALRLLKDN